MARLTINQITSLINSNAIVKKDLITVLKKRKISGLTKYTKKDLIVLFNLSNKTKKELMVDIKNNNIKGRSKFNKQKAILEVFKIKIVEIKRFDDLKNKLRLNRIVGDYKINQHPPISLTSYLPIKKNTTINTFTDISENIHIKEFNNRLYELLDDAFNSVEKIKVNLPNYVGAMVQAQYIVDENGATPRYTAMTQLKKDMDKFKITISATDITYIFINLFR